MRREALATSTTKLKQALFQTLLKRFPPKKYSPLLEDIVNSLTDALFEGEIQISLSSNLPSEGVENTAGHCAHIQALFDSGWLDSEGSPIVLDDANNVKWRRWHEEMNKVLKELQKRSLIKKSQSTNQLSKEFYSTQTRLNKEQKAAVKAILDKQVVLLSGGPGTGKTSTIAKMIERALEKNPLLRVGLAAPTGKAARRLQETLKIGNKTMDTRYQKVLTNSPCNTLHKWLGANPGGFSKNKRDPLPLDLFVIDEMSMVDLTLMKALLDALPKQCQMVLVGDPNQLPPIEIGAVWHELQQENIRKTFGEGAIHLHKLYRNRGAIASLSEILCKGNLKTFWVNLSNLPKSANIKMYCHRGNAIPEQVLQRLNSHYKNIQKLTQQFEKDLHKSLHLLTSEEELNIGFKAEPVVDALDELIVLCQTRKGSWGVEHVHNALLGKDFALGLKKWPQGTPIMCCSNQPELGLANGDIGVVIGEEKNRRLLFRVIADNQQTTIRLIHPARLKIFEPALAMTIHKAQGSEANKVILLWPEVLSTSCLTAKQDERHEDYEKKLLYTAITRARQKLDLFTKS